MSTFCNRNSQDISIIKYSPLYVAEFSFRYNNRRWMGVDKESAQRAKGRWFEWSEPFRLGRSSGGYLNGSTTSAWA
jgi:hypothetical protein